jgi:hypothetical protein
VGQFSGRIALDVIPGDARNWLVVFPFSYKTNAGDIIPIPAGLKTDLASTPRIVWNIFPPFGLYTGAAIVHDDLYTTQRFERSKCDSILLEAMVAEGVSWISRMTIYSQARAWGWWAWRQHKIENMKKQGATK